MKYPFLKIFLAGKHSTSHAKKEWGDADLEKVLTNTLANSELKIPFVAQTVKGKHPDKNLPIYGFADRSTIRKTVTDGVSCLEIQPCEFADGLLETLKDTGLDKLSVRLDGADFSLEHICFVENPAVKNIPALSDYDFSAPKEGKEWIDLSAGTSDDADFADSRMSIVGRVLRSFRDWMIGKHGLEEADKVIPDYGLHELKEWKPELPEWAREQINDALMRVRALEEQTGIRKKTTIISDYNFNNEDDMKELEEVKAAQAKTNADFADYRKAAEEREAAAIARNAALEKQLAEMRDAQIHRDNADFVDSLVREGKVLPPERDLQVQDLNLAAKQETKINFSGAEKTLLEAKKEMLSQRPVLAPLGKPIATKDSAAGGSADFSEDTEEGRRNLAKAAKELMKKENISFSEAVEQLASKEEASA